MKKKECRTRNCGEYNKSLVERGSPTVWLLEEVLEQWNVMVKTCAGRWEKSERTSLDYYEFGISRLRRLIS